MKSKLKHYNKISKLPLKTVLKRLKVTREELLNLMTVWVNQGMVSENDPHYKELLKESTRNRNREKQKLNEENYLNYQFLRQQGEDLKTISEILGRPEEKLARYNTRWFKDLKEEGLSFDEIKKEMNIPDKELRELETLFDEEIRIKKEKNRSIIKNNIEYAKEYFKKVGENPDDFLIFDLEGVQNPDEILEIAVIDLNGNTLMNTLVRPTHHIGWHVSQLTGINDRMASKGIGLYSAMRQLRRISKGKTLVSWGTDYDQILIKSAMKKTNIKLDCDFICAQHMHMGFTEKKNQIALYKAANADIQTHRALDDCHMVLKVLTDDLNKNSEEKDG